MTTLREAAQMALDALEHGLPIIEDFGGKEQLQLQHKAIAVLYEALRAALATEQEPVWGDSQVTKPEIVAEQKAMNEGLRKMVEQEPVAWMYDWYDETEDIDGVPIGGIVSDCISKDYDEAHSPTMGCHNIRPLYTAPPQRRSIPTTFSAFCEDANYAQGMKDGITHTLECLLHECDVIVRISPYVVQLTEQKPDDDSPQKFQVRARFTAREKRRGKTQGEWIKTDRAFYEEEFDDKFDTDREWIGLTDEEYEAIREDGQFGKGSIRFKNLFEAIEAKLKEKNT